MHPQVRSARIAMPGGIAMATSRTAMSHMGNHPLPLLPQPASFVCIAPPLFMHPQVRSARIAMPAGTAMSTPRTAPPTPPCSPPPYPCLLRSTTPRIAISTPGIAMSTSRSPRLHRRLIKTFCFVLSFFLRTTSSYVDLGPVLLPEPPSLVVVVALRPLATTPSWLGE